MAYSNSGKAGVCGIPARLNVHTGRGWGKGGPFHDADNSGLGYEESFAFGFARLTGGPRAS